MQRADSLAVVGSDAAAAIGPETPGRGVVDPGDGRPVPFQSAWVEPVEIEGLLRSTAELPRARRPWVGRLPDRLTPADLDVGSGTSPVPPGALVIGLVDEPERQRHERAVWTPAADGHLLVVGGPGSGRSTLISAVEHAGAAVGIGRVDPNRRLGRPALGRPHGRDRRGSEPGPARGSCSSTTSTSRFRDWPDDHRHAALRHGRDHPARGATSRRGRRRDGGIGAPTGRRNPRGLRPDGPAAASEPVGPRAGRAERAACGGPTTHRAAGSGTVAACSSWMRIRRVRAPPAPVPSARPRPGRVLRCRHGIAPHGCRVLRALGHEPVAARAERRRGGPRRRGRARPRSRRRTAGVGDADAWLANWALASDRARGRRDRRPRRRREYRVFATTARAAPAPRRSRRPSAGCCRRANDRAERHGRTRRTTETVVRSRYRH